MHAPLPESVLRRIDAAAYRFAELDIEARPPLALPPRAMVYIAGPLTHGNQVDNAAEAHRVAGMLMAVADKAGLPLATFIPHAYLVCEAGYPRHYEKWMESCFIALERCDALVRLPGHSPGADREVAEARRLGIPVFHYTPGRSSAVYADHHPRHVSQPSARTHAK